MFAACVLGRLGSLMKNVALSISTVLFSEETIDTNHPSGILTNAGPDDLMKARSAAEPSCKFHPSSRPYAPNDLRSSVSRRFRLTHVGLRDLDLELRERLSDGGNVRFDAWSFVTRRRDLAKASAPRHFEHERERERDVDLAWTIVSKDEQVLPWSTKLKPGNAVRARRPERTSKSFQPGQDQPFSVKGDFLVVRLGTPWLCVSSWYEVLLAGTDPRIVRFFWTSGATVFLYDADFTHDAFVCTVEDSAKYQCNGADDRVCVAVPKSTWLRPPEI